jgi:mannose-6-phosphate isomerase-like protein (cupin superfamily)
MDKSVEKLISINLGKTTPLRLIIWKTRRAIRDFLGKDILHTDNGVNRGRSVVRRAYHKVDRIITKFLPNVERDTPREVALKQVREILSMELNYTFADINETKPWGAYYRIADDQTDRFLAEFFPGLSSFEAKLGRKDVKLSPKIMVVYPGQRLSWQYHNRRAERWRFLTTGDYYRSHSDKPGELHTAEAGDVVQFDNGERHRLCADGTGYTLVAEIWQHADPKHPSDEADIVRLHDDYKR